MRILLEIVAIRSHVQTLCLHRLLGHLKALETVQAMMNSDEYGDE